MIDDEKYYIILAMERFGGSFVKAPTNINTKIMISNVVTVMQFS